MKIDNSRYVEFWNNPEKYRLVYEANLALKNVPFYYGRGIHLHTLNEARNKSLSSADTLAMVAENKGISDKSKQVGDALFQAFRKKFDGDDRFQLLHDEGKPLVEVEFDIAIPGSPHSIVGRMDEIIQYKDQPWVGDLKSANAKSSEDRKRTEFGFSTQPIFYINAARSMGYPVAGMLYRVVTEHVPPRLWVIESKRTEYQLAEGLRQIHQTCELIEIYRKTFGVDRPWVHLGTGYPCNAVDFKGNPVCEYAGICNRATCDLTPEDLADFVPRVDHLDVLREAK